MISSLQIVMNFSIIRQASLVPQGWEKLTNEMTSKHFCVEKNSRLVNVLLLHCYTLTLQLHTLHRLYLRWLHTTATHLVEKITVTPKQTFYLVMHRKRHPTTLSATLEADLYVQSSPSYSSILQCHQSRTKPSNRDLTITI